MDMTEKVARAIAYSDGARMVGGSQCVASRELGWKGDGGHLEKYTERHWRNYVHAAGFAIQAMRVPTPEMVNAAWNDHENSPTGVLVDESSTHHDTDDLTQDTAYEVWQAMIGVLLK